MHKMDEFIPLQPLLFIMILNNILKLYHNLLYSYMYFLFLKDNLHNLDAFIHL